MPSDLEKRKKQIIRLFENRYSLKYIGNLFKISKQRVSQIIKSKKRPVKTIFCKVCNRPFKPTGYYKYCKIHRSSLESRDKVREIIRQRDHYTCQMCGKKWRKGNRRFDVHHKDCIKEKTKKYDDYEKEKDNMITLCHKCHLNLPEHRMEMKKAKLRKSIHMGNTWLK
jgi:5-methylcytosine-specific restriction endonuclease McrA